MKNNSGLGKKTLLAILLPVVALILIAAIAIPIILTMLGRGTDNGTVEYFETPQSTLPEEEKFALSKYSYEDLATVQTTIRADVGSVTERNVKRTIPDVLTDEYALVYDKTANTLTAQYGFAKSDFNLYDVTSGNYRISNNQIEAAKINFNNKYPRVLKIGDTPAHSIGGGDVGFDAAKMAGSGLDAASYLNFYKYMLFSQCYNLTTEAATRSYATLDNAEKQADFKKWLKKHPAADSQYGRVLGSDGQPLNENNNNNAVTKVITVDPIYRSLHATGLYLPAGEPITLKIEGLKEGEQIGLKMNEQDSCAWVAGASTAGFPADYGKTKYLSGNTDGYFKPGDMATAIGNVAGVSTHNHWSKAYGRLPWLRSMVNYSKNGEYVYGSPLGGVIEIDMKNCYSRVTITISGAVETPHYILGTTTPEYFDKYLRQAPGVVAILDVENGQLIGPTMEMGTTQYMRQVKTDEIDKLAMLWHSFLSVNESFTGGVYNRFNKVMFDWLVPAGAAVSMGNYSFAQPTGWFDGCMNYRGLLEAGNWGTLHEIGHNHANSYGTFWGFGDGREGEVHNNALTLLAYISFCDIGTSIRSGKGVEHGEYANPYRTLAETINHPTNAAKLGTTDYGDGTYYHYFQMLGMYANIMHSFGADKFYELLYTYKTKSSYLETVEQPDGTKKTVGNQRSDFMYRCALIYGMNFIDYFNQFYKANITQEMFTTEQWDKIKDLPKYNPIASFYAGGIDGVKTAGDYKVTFGNDVEFDLMGKTISTLDTADKKGFEIISVEQPLHGKITKNDDGKYIYSFNSSYSGNTDEFSFNVKLADGIQHKLTIYLRISYNGIKISEYNNVVADGVAVKNLAEALNVVYSREPDKMVSTVANGVPGYNTVNGQKDIRVAEYYWRAPKDGTIKLSAKSDDWIRWYFADSFAQIESQIQSERNNKSELGGYGQISTYTNAFNDNQNYASLQVKEGKYYAIKIVNVNTGGGGSASVGYKYDGDANFVNFSTNDLFHPSFPQGQTATAYVHEPQFMVSKKDNAKLEVTGSDKSAWEIVQAPENIVGGRFEERWQYYTEITPDVLKSDPNAVLNGKIPGSKQEFDKWNYLIDGQTGTNMHTTYGGGVPKITAENPHVFILDTKQIQNFNYFTVTTRANPNSYIENCELQIANTLDGNWKSIATGERKMYSGQSLKMTFAAETGRYLKLIVKGTSGGNFSVLAELDTGIFAITQKLVGITAKQVFASKGWQNTADIAELPNGYYVTDKKGETMTIKFFGERITLYSAVGEGYGSIKIRLDGGDWSEKDLNSSNSDMRKLAYYVDNLENKEHTMEILTTSSNRVMLNLIGMPYSATLLNASNVALENALIIALLVFIGLFIAITSFVLCLVFIPGFRRALLGNKMMQRYDEYRAECAKRRKEEKQEKREHRFDHIPSTPKDADSATPAPKTKSAKSAADPKTTKTTKK